MKTSLFDKDETARLNENEGVTPPAEIFVPLPERLRPQSAEEVLGQETVLGERGTLGRMLRTGHYHSAILWGPPGCGKTTLARILARSSGYPLQTVSAVTSGVAELKKIFEEATRRHQSEGKPTLLFVDEIHRFNRSQQDIFLPYIESGTILLLGATTENPSFELNGALLSRCKVVVLNRLDTSSLLKLAERAEAHYGYSLPLDEEARIALCGMADGDGRYLLNLCEEILESISSSKEAGEVMDTTRLVTFLQKRAPLYDKTQESHYNLISALHKSLRGSDTDAALYWFCRMLAGGEDPLYIARRLVRFASEDVGMADPQALQITLAAKEAYEFLGTPEGELALAQAVAYLGTAPKSNAVYRAYKAAARDAAENGSLMPPMHILNAPTKLMKELGYSKGYAYDHDAPDGFSGQNYFPDGMKRREYYQPVERGFERDIARRMEWFARMREKRQQEQGE
jgi:putative ATPase